MYSGGRLCTGMCTTSKNFWQLHTGSQPGIEKCRLQLGRSEYQIPWPWITVLRVGTWYQW